MLRSIYLTIALIAAPVAISAISAAPAHAKSDEVYTSVRNNFGAGSFDVVSFHLGTPLKGNMKITADWNGAQWRFVSAANRDLFLSDPEKYAPAYGGYCAWALAMNKLAKGSPKHWSVVNGVLYLNFNKKIKKKWLEDTEGFIEQGNANWPKILE